ncbi:uncharacterized protein [Oryctolagus cuniculus]|uniref:uncharacterized protein n=1 Tax=Oryctolagus cuniculus TaxID=9986 RepID=UPI00387A01D4
MFVRISLPNDETYVCYVGTEIRLQSVAESGRIIKSRNRFLENICSSFGAFLDFGSNILLYTKKMHPFSTVSFRISISTGNEERLQPHMASVLNSQ